MRLGVVENLIFVDLGPLTFWPAAFWLVPPVLAVLIWLRYFRTRRQEILAGSLLLWRRLAAQQPKAPTKRVIVDRSLILQAIALISLIAAIAAPSFSSSRKRGRGLVLVLDNSAIARGGDSWDGVMNRAAAVLKTLQPDDLVYLARTAPLPNTLTPGGVPPAEARKLLDRLSPSLTYRSPDAVWRDALDAAALLNAEAPLALVVISLAEKPAPSTPGKQWLSASADSVSPPNVGLVEFGSVPLSEEGKSAYQVLVRLKNTSAAAAVGSVSLQPERGEKTVQRVELPSNGEHAAVFAVPQDSGALRIAWQRDDGQPDALPEDDVIVADARSINAPRVRFHTPVPALERLYTTALNADFLREQKEGADLEIFVGAVPDKWPDGARGLMLLAPRTGFQSIFDVGPQVLAWPRAQRDEENELTRGLGDTIEGLFAIPKAAEILRTGDFKTLVKDSKTNRALIARFQDQQQRFGLLLAFVPGQGFGADRLLEPELSAILVRAALAAAGSGEPFYVTRAAALELKSAEALPAQWTPAIASGTRGGVLDLNVTQLKVGAPDDTAFNASALQPLERGARLDLGPWLILLALALLAWESLGALSARRLSARRPAL